MSTWELECEFHRVLNIQGEGLGFYFYGTFPSPDYLPPELQAIDTEISDFVTKTEQQWFSVYSPATGIDAVLSRRFQERTLKLTRPLLKRRQVLCEQFNASDRLCSVLPPEMVSRIFEFVVSPHHVDDTISSTPYLSETFRLASVTRAWRSIALANPNLWSSIRLAHSDTAEEEGLELYLETLEHILRRSGCVGLHIHIRIGCSCGDCFDPLLAIIRREALRIFTLRICVVPHTYRASEYLACFDFPFPKANVVVVHAATDFTDVSTLPFIIPCVTQLCLRSHTLGEFWPYFSTITNLELGRISLYELRFILQAATALTVLKVSRRRSHVPEMVEIDNLTGDIILRSNGNTTSVEPVVHVRLQSLDVDDTEALAVITLPSLQSLCLWSSHVGLERFIIRSGCKLIRFGVAQLSAIQSISVLDTVKHVYIDQQHFSPFESFLETLNEYDETQADLLNLTLGRLESITVRIAYCSICRPTTAFCALLPVLLEFHRKYGSRLKRFDIHTECCVWVSLDTYNSTPPIYINGYPIEHYNKPWSGPSWQNRHIGRDRLDWLDRVILLCLQTKAWLGLCFNALTFTRLFSWVWGQGTGAHGWERGDVADGWGSDVGVDALDTQDNSS